MNVRDLFTDMEQLLTSLASQYLPGDPSQTLRYMAGAALAIGALLLLIIALRLMKGNDRPKRGSSKRVNIPRTIQQEGMVMDILNPGEQVAVRCVVTSVSSGKIKCEIIERLDVMKTNPGDTLFCVFQPIKTDNGKINSFTTKLIETDKMGRNTDRVVLAAPTSYANITRRKHARKKVADQQFIRVKLWVANPRSSDIPFMDAAPQIGINSFAADGQEQAANAVVNISGGGLGLSIINRVIPETCGVGAHVTINLFMFNFKKKSFKPYWYSGTVRSMEEGRPGFTRMGVEFDGVGQPDDESGCIRWTSFEE